MNFFREMDLYKWVIVASLLLLPAAGWWIKKSSDDIQAAKKAITEATADRGRDSAWLTEIGKLQSQIELVNNNKLSIGDATEQPQVYFETQIFRSVKDGMKKDQFQFKPQRQEERAVAGSEKQRANEFIIGIDFVKGAGKEFEMSREVLQAILFNCESGAKDRGVQAQSIWKLSSLSVANATAPMLLTTHKTPPPDLEDRWVVKDLQFARREPIKDRK